MTRSVRATHSHTLPLPRSELIILSFGDAGWVIGPFWAWKVGPATAVVTPTTNI